MKIYAIGDVHGCLNEMKALLAKVDEQIKPEDQIVFLGDYVDRGPDSKGVIEHLIEREKSHQNKHIFIRGNHEDMMMSGEYWFMNGGAEVVKSYGLDPVDYTIQFSFFSDHMPKDHQAFIHRTRLYYQIGRCVFVHANIDPSLSLEDQNANTLIWARHYDGYNGDYNGGWFVVRGHTPVGSVREFRNQIMLDTACVFGGFLTCLVIDPENTDDHHYLEVQSGVSY